MLVSLRAKNQITLPKPILDEAKISKDDKLDISINENGEIVLKPVKIVDRKFLQDLQEAFEDVKNGNISKATSANKIIEELSL